MKLWTIFLLKLIHVTCVKFPPNNQDGETTLEMKALNAILGKQHRSSILIVTEENSTLGDVGELKASSGVGVFEVMKDWHESNITQVRLTHVIGLARQLRRVSWSVTVVVVSDDPAFLITFTEWSLKGRLLVWSTRLLVLTRLPLHRLHHLRNTLAMTNSMLLIFSHTPTFRCTVYLKLPFGAGGDKYKEVARWTTQKGLTSSQLPFFPDKFERLENRPSIKVTYVKHSSSKTEMIDDPESPGGKREIVQDPAIRFFEIIAKSINFKLQIKLATTWGSKLPNGSYTGMVGMVQRKEVDFSLIVMHASYVRSLVVDFTIPVSLVYSRIIVRRATPEVDPWGFLLPFRPLVWVGLLTVLLGVIVVLVLMPKCFPDYTLQQSGFFSSTFNCVRVFLQEDLTSIESLQWSERLVLGVWMIMMVVLQQSYAGNLMSLLAVRYIPMPIQTLQDVLTAPVIFVPPAGTSTMRFFTEAKSGVFRDIGDLQQVGRFQPVYVSNLKSYLDKHVRRGTHVMIEANPSYLMVAQDFSEKGRCDFYLAREKLIPMFAAYAVSKDFPMLPAFNRRVMRLSESGILRYWEKQYTPNLTACLYPPKTVAVRSSLSFINVWGIFVVLAGGGAAGTLVLGLELLYSLSQQKL